MSEPLSAARPDFFGKDSFTPFIGVIEDVDDPKHSGRVKVRCIGWHPADRSSAGGDSLTTEELPWARVGMPTTHAQQSRIGGKHGLLPGCWVFGFFLDGEEAQDPFVLSSFSFTSKASEKDNRKMTAGTTGTMAPSAGAFDKQNISQATTKGNTSTHTDKEQGIPGFKDPNDPAGDNVNNDSDSECGGKAATESVASAASKGDFKTPENPVGQNVNVTDADGLCGSNAHASEDIQLKMQERFPSQYNRFNYGDIVWQKFSGNYMDINGILAQMALEISSILKQNVESLKSEQETQNFRDTKGAEIEATNGRDPNARIALDDRQRRESDLFNASIGALIDGLLPIIMSLLQSQNNGRSSEEDKDNRGGSSGAQAETPINDPSAKCFTNQFMNNFNAVITRTIDEAVVVSKATIETATKADDDDGSGSSAEEIMNAISTVIGFGTGVVFPLTEKYAEKTNIFNSQGDKSQDESTRRGCKQQRQYNTEMGASGSAALVAALRDISENSQSNNSNSTSNGKGSTTVGATDADIRKAYGNIGFGGMTAPTTGVVDFTPCEDATIIKVPDDGSNYDSSIIPGLNTKPAGYNGDCVSLSLPSANPLAAENFIDGIPNSICVKNPGSNYHYHNDIDPERVFPSIWIPEYNGTPVPVLNRETGEFVAILTIPPAWSRNHPLAPITIIPDNSTVGIFTDNPNYDLELGGFYIANTGFNYCSPTIDIFDYDRGDFTNGEVEPVMENGRIVEVNIINSGTGFLRIPRVDISDDGWRCSTQGGYGARIYPIMNLIPKPDSKESVPAAVQNAIFCPAKNQLNFFPNTRDPQEVALSIVTKAASLN